MSANSVAACLPDPCSCYFHHSFVHIFSGHAGIPLIATHSARCCVQPVWVSLILFFIMIKCALHEIYHFNHIAIYWHKVHSHCSAAIITTLSSPQHSAHFTLRQVPPNTNDPSLVDVESQLLVSRAQSSSHTY